MTRFIAIAAVVLIALSTGMMGLADLHRGTAGDTPAPQAHTAMAHGSDAHGSPAAQAPMPEHRHGHRDGKHDRAGYHTACAIAGHSCAGYVAPEPEAVTRQSYTRQGWTVPSHRLAAGLKAEATTPPPRA